MINLITRCDQLLCSVREDYRQLCKHVLVLHVMLVALQHRPHHRQFRELMVMRSLVTTRSRTHGANQINKNK